MAKSTIYAAVRINNGREFIDIESIDLLPELVKININTTEQDIPSWCKENPVVRVVKCEISEIV